MVNKLLVNFEDLLLEIKTLNLNNRIDALRRFLESKNVKPSKGELYALDEMIQMFLKTDTANNLENRAARDYGTCVEALGMSQDLSEQDGLYYLFGGISK
jgi:hypothetical protein